MDDRTKLFNNYFGQKEDETITKLKEIKRRIQSQIRGLEDQLEELNQLIKELDRNKAIDMEKELEEAREVIKDYVDKNGNKLNKKKQTELYKLVNEKVTFKTTLVNILKSLQISYKWGEKDKNGWAEIIIEL